MENSSLRKALNASETHENNRKMNILKFTLVPTEINKTNRSSFDTCMQTEFWMLVMKEMEMCYMEMIPSFMSMICYQQVFCLSDFHEILHRTAADTLRLFLCI